MMNRSWTTPLAYAVLGVALVVTYLVLGPSLGTEWLVCGANALGALAIVAATVRHRPVRPVPWVLIALGLAGTGAAHLAAAREWFGGGGIQLPGALQAYGVLAYPALFVGVASLTSTQRRARDLLAGSEPIIYAIAFTAMVWLGVSGPYQTDGDVPMADRAWIWVLPLLNVLLALMALRGAARRDESRSALNAFALGWLVSGAAHAVVAWRSFQGDLAPGSALLAGLAIGPVLVGSAALFAGAGGADRADPPPGRVHWSQILGLLVAALLPLAALILMLATDLDSPASFVVVSVATVSVVVLALARMWRLVDQVRRLTEQRGHDRLAAMVEHSSDVVMLADPAGRVSYASPGLRGTLGRDPQSWIGRHLVDVISAEERESALASVRAAGSVRDRRHRRVRRFPRAR